MSLHNSDCLGCGGGGALSFDRHSYKPPSQLFYEDQVLEEFYSEERAKRLLERVYFAYCKSFDIPSRDSPLPKRGWDTQVYSVNVYTPVLTKDLKTSAIRFVLQLETVFAENGSI